MRIVRVYNRGASYVDLKTADDTHYVGRKVSLVAICTRNKRGGIIMVRQLISVRKLIQDLKEEGLDIGEVYLDREDVVEIPEAEEEN